MQKMQISIKKGKKKGRFMAYFFQQSQFCAGYKLNPHSNSIFFLLKLRTNACESGVSIGQPIMNSLDVLMIFKLAQTFAYAKNFFTRCHLVFII